eukprot:6588489-Pyramimonas_sp.AAC.1
MTARLHRLSPAAKVNLCDVLANVHLLYLTEVWHGMRQEQRKAFEAPRLRSYRTAIGKQHHIETNEYTLDAEILWMVKRVGIERAIKRMRPIYLGTLFTTAPTALFFLVDMMASQHDSWTSLLLDDFRWLSTFNIKGGTEDWTLRQWFEFACDSPHEFKLPVHRAWKH